MGSKLIKGSTKLRVSVSAPLLHRREALLWTFSSASTIRCQPHRLGEDFKCRLYLTFASGLCTSAAVERVNLSKHI